MEDRPRVLVGECISRAAVEAAREATLDQIAEAIDACDYERAATAAFGRVRAGESVPGETIARILPGIELPAITLALIAIAPARAHLIELVEQRMFPEGKDSAELEAIVLFAAWRGGAELARVIPEVRRLSARAMSVEGYALLAVIARAIDDANLAAATKPIAGFATELAKQVDDDETAMAASIDDILASLPAEVETPVAAGFTVRTAKQVGRNDPCPCGSGLKFKKCCADKQATPSPIAGLSYDEFLGSGAARMTIDHVAALPLCDLAKVALARLSGPPLVTAYRRFITAREWRRAEQALEQLAKQRPDEADGWRWELVERLLECRCYELARAQVSLMTTDRELFDVELAIHDDAARGWHAVVEAGQRALTSESKLPDVELAHTLLRAEPTIGIYFARACIGTLHVDDPDILLDSVEEARDQLNLPPGDPAWDVLDELTVEAEPDAQEDTAKLRDLLQQSSERIEQLERALATLRGELDAAHTRAPVELIRAPADAAGAGDRAHTLDAKVRELEAVIRAGNAERVELRKQLRQVAPDQARNRREGPRARRVMMPDPDDDVGDDVDAKGRGIAVPRFERRVTDALADAPSTVAAEAMRTIGTLAAGDSSAWRSVKQAKDMVRPVLMARVGIHHRLLFRVDAGALDVLDLITREQLLTTLKRLRSAR